MLSELATTATLNGYSMRRSRYRREDPLESIDIQAEAELIRQKKSALPRRIRDMVMARSERIPKAIEYTDELTSDIKKAIESDGVVLVKKEALDAQA